MAQKRDIDKERKSELIAEMLKDGYSPKEINAKTGISISYIYHFRTDSFDAMLTEWDAITEALKNSGRDLSKIKIVKRRAEP